MPNIFMKIKNILLLVYFCTNMSLFGAIVVDNPGIYSIGNNFIYTATAPNDSVILINTNNVSIDFEDSQLTLISDNTFPNIDGIVINTNLSNISINNLNVKNVSGIGIHILDGCSNINIMNGTIQGCQESGIFFDGDASGTGINNNVISNCKILSSTGSNGNAVYGIRIANSPLCKISDSQISFNDTDATNSAYGIYLENSPSFEIAHTTIVGNGGTHLIAGLAVVQSFTGLIENVTIQKNIGRSTGTVCGMLLDQTQNILVTHCKSSSNIHSTSTSVGFIAQNGKCNIFNRCIAELNTGGSYAAGFSLDGERESYIGDCLIHSQNTSDSGTGYGIFLSENCNKCQIISNKIYNNKGISTSFGIYDESPYSNNVVIKNYAFNNGTNYSITYTTNVSLPLLSASTSGNPGLPNGTGGLLDNIDISP